MSNFRRPPPRPPSSAPRINAREQHSRHTEGSVTSFRDSPYFFESSNTATRFFLSLSSSSTRMAASITCQQKLMAGWPPSERRHEPCVLSFPSTVAQRQCDSIPDGNNNDMFLLFDACEPR